MLGLDQEVIEFEINPDRAYALSLRGVAREAALAYGAPYRDPAQRDVPAPNDQGYPVVVDDPAGCPVFVARTVSGIDPAAATPEWMAQRLTLSGMRPISLAVDVTNYVMLELGRPIHGYDADKLSGPIRVRRAAEGERLTTLDGTDRALSTEDLVVTDDSGIIGLGGVMGGQTTEMSETTTRVLVEAAHWDAVSMFRTGKRHKLTSEAGKRNERGVDPMITPGRRRPRGRAAGRPTAAARRSPASPSSASRRRRPSIAMAADLPARISGIDISAETTVANLEAVGCTVEAGDPLTATPPPWRPDLNDPYDLVEEVARIVGYDQVPSVLPRDAAGRGLTREQRLRRRIGRTLAGAGCVEVISFPFIGDAAFDQLGLPADDVLRKTVRLANPLSTEEPSLHDDAAARPAARGRAQPRSRCAGRGAVRDRHRRVPGRPRPGADLRRRLAAQRRRAGQAGGGAARPAAVPGRRARRASASGPAGGARAVRRAGRTRSGWSAGSAPSWASTSR